MCSHSIFWKHLLQTRIEAMGLQLIICVESDAQSKSDFMYIRSLLNAHYIIDPSSIKLSPVYMGGRGNYASKKTKTRIADYTKKYNGAARDNRTVVIYCFDCDNYDKQIEDKDFLEAAKQFCDDHGYSFIWFCRDIEDVFWNKHVPEHQKKVEAAKFATGKHVRSIKLENLRKKTYRNQCSNICLVLDGMLENKKGT